MPLLLELATERLARTRLDYAVMEQSIALPLLSSGELDWFVGWDYPVSPAVVGPKLEVTIVAQERLCAYLPLDHPLSGRDGVQLAELRDDYWVASPAGSPHHSALKQYARDAGFDADIRYATADSHTAVNLPRAGSAVTYGAPLTRPVWASPSSRSPTSSPPTTRRPSGRWSRGPSCRPAAEPGRPQPPSSSTQSKVRVTAFFHCR